MTCIVGIAHEDAVYMGSDSIIASGDTYVTTAQKVFPVGPLLVGASGKGRFVDVIRWKLADYLPGEVEGDPDRWMRGVFVAALQDVLRVGGHLKTEDGGVHKTHGTLLVGWSGRLWCVYSDFAVVDCPGVGFAIGGGGEAARGALSATRWKVRPVDGVRLALAAAASVVTTVREPHRVWRLAEGQVQEL